MGILPVPFNTKEVQDVLTATSGLFNGTLISSNNVLVQELISLRDICAAQEKALFSSIPHKTPEDLSAKLTEWQSNPISEKLQSLQADLLNYSKSMPKKDNAKTINTFLSFVGSKLKEDQQFLRQFKSEEIGPTFFGEIAKRIKKDNFRFVASGKENQPGSRTGLFKLLTYAKLKTKQKNGVFSAVPKVEITEEQVPNIVSKGFLKKIEQYCASNLKGFIYTDPNTQFLEYVEQTVPEYLTPPYLGYYVQLKPTLSINYSEASIIGFIGELRAAFQFIDLFGFENIFMVGSLRKLGSKERQVPIDMVLKAGMEQMFNIQVKNYKVVSGKSGNYIQVSKSLSAEEFVDGRLSLTGAVGEILKAFFGTYQFNQPFKNPKLQDKVAIYEDTTYSLFETYFNNLKFLFDSRIGDILKIRDEFQVGGEKNPFSNKQMYYNSLFLIGNRVVTSSSILDQMIRALIEELNGGSRRSITSYTMSQPIEKPTREHTKINPTEKLVYGQNFNDLASKINISYRIKIFL